MYRIGVPESTIPKMPGAGFSFTEQSLQKFTAEIERIREADPRRETAVFGRRESRWNAQGLRSAALRSMMGFHRLLATRLPRGVRLADCARATGIAEVMCPERNDMGQYR
jgi:hypothetical protein